jgi:hypothetical protein
MMKAKDMLEIGVGATLMAPIQSMIGGAGMGAIGGATQSMVSLGFIGHTAGKIKGWFK